MITDDERREVAARLMDEVGCGSSWPGMERLGLILGIEREPRTGWEGRFLTRLADLIYSGDMSQGRRDNVACDRDALLALAEEIEDGDVTYCVSTQYVLDSYARRIREALGVQDA